jgi:hypothetical protein
MAPVGLKSRRCGRLLASPHPLRILTLVKHAPKLTVPKLWHVAAVGLDIAQAADAPVLLCQLLNHVVGDVDLRGGAAAAMQTPCGRHAGEHAAWERSCTSARAVAPGQRPWAVGARRGLHSLLVCRRLAGSAVAGGKQVTGGLTHAGVSR